MKSITKPRISALLLAAFVFASLLSSCGSKGGKDAAAAPQGPQELPVIAVSTGKAVDTNHYSGAIQGIANVSIQPQVTGYLNHIYVDEGAFVRKGQTLFQIDDRTYREQLANAIAALKSAEAGVLTSQIAVDKQQGLLDKKVISPINLRSAKASMDAAVAGVAQARAAVQSARINLGFCTIKAPVSGYVGSIPNKLGSLVSPGGSQPLTTVSDVSKVFVYFSMGEDAYMSFQKKFPGNTIEAKLRNTPPVSLQLADGSIYIEKGKIEVVEGQFNQSTASIQFRATFPNPGGILRTGNTGVVLLSQPATSATLVPIASTTDLQDKIYVWKVEKNAVHQAILTVAGKSGVYYAISGGINPGDKIVASGFDRLTEGTPIKPQEAK